MGVHIVIAATLLAGGLVSNPDWVRKPDGEAVAEAYPGLAGFLKIEGRATLACAVADTGATRSCEVVFEQPAKLGFGEAALKLAKDFQMRPLTVSGAPIDGGAVRIPFTFKQPADEPETADARPDKPTQAALDLANRLLAETGVIDQATPDLRRGMAAMDYAVDSDIDPRLWERAVKAYAEAYRETLPAIRDRMAELMAESFTEAQLTEFVRLAASPEARADMARAIAPLTDLVINDVVLDTLRNRARARFCAEVDCTSAAATP